MRGIRHELDFIIGDCEQQYLTISVRWQIGDLPTKSNETANKLKNMTAV